MSALAEYNHLVYIDVVYITVKVNALRWHHEMKLTAYSICAITNNYTV